VNQELEGLDMFVTTASNRLAAGARLGVISFHSLEDRVIKHTFRALAARERGDFRIVTKRPLTASEQEVAANPRARSAKLRVLERA
jgi:16S rRNA (cytosine1402-N4)-methyltransferase